MTNYKLHTHWYESAGKLVFYVEGPYSLLISSVKCKKTAATSSIVSLTLLQGRVLFYALEYVNVFLLLLTQSLSLTFFLYLPCRAPMAFQDSLGQTARKEQGWEKKIKYMHTESLSFPSDQEASYILKGDTYD